VNKFLLPLVFALVLLSGTLSQGVYAHGNLDQTTTTCSCNAVGSLGGPNNIIRYQEFVPTQSGLVSIEIEIQSNNLASVNPITVNLRNGGPTGAIIGTTTTHTGLPPAVSTGTAHFDFGSPIALTPGNLHTIEIEINDGSSDILWFGNTGNPYPLGASYSRFAGSLGMPSTTIDLTLKTFFLSQVVGGEFLPIETTSLLLAAAQSPASWLTTLTIAALGIGVYVFTRNPNNMRNIKVILRDYLDRL